MIGLDTNILVRYLTQDDQEQAEKAVKLIESNLNQKCSMFINNIVFCELIWVLERGYKYSKQQIASAIRMLLGAQEFAFEQLDSLWIALDKYEKDKIDFSDALIGELNKSYKCAHTYSFDTQASKMSNFELL
jgi:predicted nucleic-acid-binding protein